MIFRNKFASVCALFLLCYCTTALYAQKYTQLSALLPMPNRIVEGQAKHPFVVSSKTRIQTNFERDSFYVNEVQKIFQNRMNQPVKRADKQKKGSSIVELSIDPTLQGNEHYNLEVTSKKIRIAGRTKAAIFHGIQTLDQLLLGDVCHTGQNVIAPIYIDDEPRFSHRALMLDPARHMLPVKDVKFFIDQMVKYKYNVLQLHLTDDQGWRIEIKSHPKLTKIGGNCCPDVTGTENGFYTQKELKEIIDYAAERHIEVIPELDVPGHATAVVAAYPEIRCLPMQKVKQVKGKPIHFMVCANNEKAYALYDDVIKEVATLFPSSQIHLGGDEAIMEENWCVCDSCQQLMKRLGYTEERQLMNYFFKNILASVRKYNKKAILWCELDQIKLPANEYLFDYPKDVTLVTWRQDLTLKCIELTEKYGHSLIMSPGEYAYLDYPQLKGDLPEFNNWGMPITTLKTSYEFDPGFGLPKEKQKHIQGIMGTLWGEAMIDINRVTYMAFPRGLALAEAGWTQMEHRDWNSFKERLFVNLSDLMRTGVSVRVPFEIVERK